MNKPTSKGSSQNNRTAQPNANANASNKVKYMS